MFYIRVFDIERRRLGDGAELVDRSALAKAHNLSLIDGVSLLLIERRGPATGRTVGEEVE